MDRKLSDRRLRLEGKEVSKMKWFFLIALSVLLLGAAPSPPSEVENYVRSFSEVKNYVTWFFRESPRGRADRALRLVPKVLKHAEKYSIDPLLVAVSISLESSWIPGLKGPKGEIGLLQCKGPHVIRDFDLRTVDGQIACGVHWIRKSIDKCPDMVEAFNNYLSGRCSPLVPGALKRDREYSEAVRRFRSR